MHELRSLKVQQTDVEDKKGYKVHYDDTSSSQMSQSNHNFICWIKINLIKIIRLICYCKYMEPF